MPHLELVRISKATPRKKLVLLQGVPGLGLVGKIAVQYLIDQFSPPLVARIYSDYLPLPDGSAGVRVADGDVSPATYDLYLLSTDSAEADFLLLTSEVQPIPWGQYSVGERVLDFAEELGVSEVLTFGGYVPGSAEVEGIFACSNDEGLWKRLEECGVNRLQGGFVTGAAGLLVGLAYLRGIPSACVLSTTEGQRPDPRASKRLILLLGKMYGLEVSLEELDELIREEESVRAILEEKAKQALEEKRGWEERKEEEEGPLPYHL